MGRRAKFSKTDARRAIEDADGIVSVAAQILNVTSSTMYNYLHRYDLWDKVQAERDELVHLAKKGLSHHLRQNEPPEWAIKFTLTTLDKEFEQWSNINVDFADPKERLARLLAGRSDDGSESDVAGESDG